MKRHDRDMIARHLPKYNNTCSLSKSNFKVYRINLFAAGAYQYVNVYIRLNRCVLYWEGGDVRGIAHHFDDGNTIH